MGSCSRYGSILIILTQVYILLHIPKYIICQINDDNNQLENINYVNLAFRNLNPESSIENPKSDQYNNELSIFSDDSRQPYYGLSKLRQLKSWHEDNLLSRDVSRHMHVDIQRRAIFKRSLSQPNIYNEPIVKIDTSGLPQHGDVRCKCVCPSTPIVDGSPSNVSRRRLYVKDVPPDKCKCEEVVRPNLPANVTATDFCPRCECKYQSRNTRTIKWFVIFTIFVVSSLSIYMAITTGTRFGIAYESWSSDDNESSSNPRGPSWQSTQAALNRTKFGGATAWLCLMLIGIVSGCVASVVDIATSWMKDLREGICPAAFYLNREQCCWSSSDTFFEGAHCSKWVTWPQLLGIIGDHHPILDYLMSFLTYLVSSLLFATLAALLVKRFAPHARGSGIPEVKTILSGFVIKGYLGKWTFAVKSICMVLVVAAGLSLGKEGPFVHIACCVGNIISHFFPKYARNDAKKREILSASSAAGVSVAFGAPIGGVLFSLEEVSYYFPLKTLWRSFFCALVAAFIVKSINPFSNEHMVMFYVAYTRPWILFELIPFALLGALGGIIGSMFIKFNVRWCYTRKNSILSQYPVTEVLAIAFITSFFGYPIEFTRMNSSELIKLLFSPCGIADVSMLCDYQRNFTGKLDSTDRIEIAEAGPGVYRSLFFLTVALIFKFTITIFTFGMAIPTGLFIPAMTMGAITGRIIGVMMEQIAFNYPDLWIFQNACSSGENCMTPGLYAMVGAAAVLAGVTRMTISLVVIMFELTSNADFTVPVMVAVMCSKWVGDAFGRQSIYDAHIYLNDYPCLDPEEKFNAANSISTMQLERVSEET